MSAVPETNGEVALENKLKEVDINKNTPANAIAPPSTSIAASPVAAWLREIEQQARKSNGVLKTPIVDPLPSIPPPPIIALTSDQQTKYDALLTTVKSWTEIPCTKAEKAGPLTENEIMWLTRECLLRYLRATKWDLAEAGKRLLSTMTWRRDYGLEDITADYISPENESGKQWILGYDIAGRPCQYLNPGRQNTQLSPRQVQHWVFMLERSISLLGPGRETLALMINFKASKERVNTAPSIGQGREVLNILQSHYPERLGRACVINVPWLVWGFLKLITPFIDPTTKEKLKFDGDMKEHVPPEQLATSFMGDLNFEYDHAEYWPALNKLCDERIAEQKERWVKAGKHFGESEVYLRGGNAASVAAAPPLVVKEVTEDSKSAPTIPVPSNKDNATIAPGATVVPTVPVAAEEKVTNAPAAA
ncbi:hypothetical protein HYALB_00003516 [Hymenoscyphus albidus]|uniref:CRAL-TRIO domain-containing protein n=1 Tax=Hymenoscyphus albidus TaxID=595503 RepID=A0A9N9Q273_9HELO|nr:hypothetical protein HYALB_00003516 [Hymenoscyphus albidus]